MHRSVIVVVVVLACVLSSMCGCAKKDDAAPAPTGSAASQAEALSGAPGGEKRPELHHEGDGGRPHHGERESK